MVQPRKSFNMLDDDRINPSRCVHFRNPNLVIGNDGLPKCDATLARNRAWFGIV
jgi:hypothetical protein